MTIQLRRYGVSEGFPIAKDDIFFVRERGRIVERWRVISAGKKSFYAEITTFVEADQ